VPALPGTPLEPFVRPMPGSRWTVQVAATKSAAAAGEIRAALAARGIAATVGAAVVGDTMWHRVVVGEHATRAAAERAGAALTRDLAAR
jgi:cell division protein FtsN